MPRSMTSGSRVPRNTSRSKPFRTAVTAEPKRATNLSTTASSSRWQGWVAPPKYPEKWRRLYFGLRASARAERKLRMQFGIFYEHQLPRPWSDGDEQRLFQEALDQVELADRLGIDFAWEVEHHFLEEYSHSSAPEIFLAACSQ